MLPGGMELWVILFVIVLLFGTKKLPELGAGLGKAINNFRDAYKENKAIDVTPGKKTGETSDKKPE